MTENTQQQVAGASTPVKILLVLSLSVNLLILGAVGATIWKFSGMREARAPELNVGIVPMMLALPTEDFRSLRQDLRDQAQAMAPPARQRAHFRNLLEVLRASPFDDAALAGLFAEQSAFAQARGAQGQRRLLAAIRAMDDDERQLYADRVEHGLSIAERRRRSSR